MTKITQDRYAVNHPPNPSATYTVSPDGSVWIQSRFKIIDREDLPLSTQDDLETWHPLKKYIILDTATGEIRGMSDSHSWCFHKICLVENEEKKGNNNG